MGYEGIEAKYCGEEILIADNSDEYLKSLETLSENSVYQNDCYECAKFCCGEI